MKKAQTWLMVGALMAMVSGAGAQGSNPVHLFNRLRVGWDDNIYQIEGKNGREKTDSFRLIEEIELAVNLELDRAYLGLKYRPSLTWYAEREDDETDFCNDLRADFTYELTQELKLTLSDTLRANQMPELQDGDYVVRANDDSLYNDVHATLSYLMPTETRIDLAGRYYLLRYQDNDDLKKSDDYWSAVGGVTLSQVIGKHTSGMVDFRYQTLQYDKAPAELNRDVDSVFGGLGIEQGLGKQASVSLRAGVQHRMYDNSLYDDQTHPYVDGSLTVSPTEAKLTRLTLSAGWAIAESDISQYLCQDRIRVALTLAHKLTQRLELTLSGAYTLGKYDADDALAKDMGDVDENTYMANARLAYQIGERNWVELGYVFTSLDSDLDSRESYDRNRVDLGWKLQLF